MISPATSRVGEMMDLLAEPFRLGGLPCDTRRFPGLATAGKNLLLAGCYPERMRPHPRKEAVSSWQDKVSSRENEIAFWGDAFHPDGGKGLSLRLREI